MSQDVFISYSSKDKPTADAVCAKLESNGIRCWIAPRDVLAGQNWGQSIVGAIKGAQVMVLVFSAHANFSPQIVRELERAASRGLLIIPFRIEEVKPATALEFYISTAHWLDAITPPLEAHLENLTQVVRKILADPPRKAFAAASAKSPPLPEPVQEELPETSIPVPQQGNPEQAEAAGMEDRENPISVLNRPLKFVSGVFTLLAQILLLVLLIALFWVFMSSRAETKRQEQMQEQKEQRDEAIRQQQSQHPRQSRSQPVAISAPSFRTSNPTPSAAHGVNATNLSEASNYSVSGNNWIRLISTTPVSPATLKAGQVMTVNLQYSIANSGSIRINVQPMTAGLPTPWRPGQTELTGRGFARSFFSCVDKDVDQLKVEIHSIGTQPGSITAYFPVDFHWLDAPTLPGKTPIVVHAGRVNSVEVVSTTPASPATLKLGEWMTIRIRYSFNTRAVRLWYSPMSGGGNAMDESSGSDVYYPASGYGETDFSKFANQSQTDVDELEVKMVDCDTEVELARTSVHIEAHWR